MSILETIEAFNVVCNAYNVVCLSNFVENIINKRLYEPARAFRDLCFARAGSFNFLYITDQVIQYITN